MHFGYIRFLFFSILRKQRPCFHIQIKHVFTRNQLRNPAPSPFALECHSYVVSRMFALLPRSAAKAVLAPGSSASHALTPSTLHPSTAHSGKREALQSVILNVWMQDLFISVFQTTVPLGCIFVCCAWGTEERRAVLGSDAHQHPWPLTTRCQSHPAPSPATQTNQTCLQGLAHVPWGATLPSCIWGSVF